MVTKIHVVYCGGWGYGSKFRKFSDELKKACSGKELDIVSDSFIRNIHLIKSCFTDQWVNTDHHWIFRGHRRWKTSSFEKGYIIYLIQHHLGKFLLLRMAMVFQIRRRKWTRSSRRSKEQNKRMNLRKFNMSSTGKWYVQEFFVNESIYLEYHLGMIDWNCRLPKWHIVWSNKQSPQYRISQFLW